MFKTKNKPDKLARDQSLVITRVIDALPAEVFSAWIKPEKVMKWFSPKDFTVPFCTIDLQVGGICRLCMRSSDGQDFWSQGVFREIEKPNLIVRTDSFSDENGNIVSPKLYGFKDWPDETIVTVTFDDFAGKTKLTVKHSPVPYSKERDMCEQGWSECLDKLTEYLRKE